MTFFARAMLAGTLVTALHAAGQSPAIFRAYSACTFSDGLTLGEISVLPAGIRGRTVDTLTGPRQVDILGGEHISFSYPNTDFFATVKIERLPAASFLQGKNDLIGNFDHILARGDDSRRNMTYVLRPRLNGFEIYGLDRIRLEGSRSASTCSSTTAPRSPPPSTSSTPTPPSASSPRSTSTPSCATDFWPHIQPASMPGRRLHPLNRGPQSQNAP